ncbi:MAG: UDP-N-acetylglucosamine 2-epimerase (non-hydrolyzing) [Candidatus Bathyarchaeota archaeon]|nr:UDP-N-acetylglucosamine 2-epimerase (non-hydrolyzing) [Candidatus Bathyarchaeota archaeon]
MKILVILGTRPEVVKFSPIIRECQRLGLDYFILHTGQHYSYNMDRVFFEQLNLPEASFNLDVGSGFHGQQTGKMLIGIEKILQQTNPDVVLVQGDTNTVLAGAVAAGKLDIKVGHVEAGLRSYDRGMPEEVNRVLADHCSDYLFAPTEKSKQILLHEGIPEEKVFVVGNTVVDAVYQNLEIAKAKSKILNDLAVEEGQFMLATSHRQENVDNKEHFAGLIRGLQLVQQEFNVPIIYPIHPRAKKQLELFGIDTTGLTLVEPLDYLAFLQLECKAKLVLTDSGGVQEETCILGVPCVTLRENTERPETIDVGSNILAGTDSVRILKAAKEGLTKSRIWVNPFGDGTTGQKIVNVLRDNFS